MKASLLISTNNREKPLETLLEQLPLQEAQPEETILVVGPEGGETLKMLQRAGYPVKILRCFDYNLSKSRNIGLQAAKGDIAVFIDDDALPLNPQWLGALLAKFDHNDRLSAVGGSVLIGDTDKFEFERKTATFNEYGQSITPLSLQSRELLSTNEFLRVQGCNCAFRVSMVKAVGGFDEWFDYYHDETDLVLRLLKAGFECDFNEAATVRHFSRADDFSSPLTRRYWFKTARSDTYCMLKNSPMNHFVVLMKCITKLPRRYYWREVNEMHKHKLISRSEKFMLKSKLLAGWAQGAYRGFFRSRRCTLSP